MFPLRDHNPSLSTPWMTGALIVANALIWLASLGFTGDEAHMLAFYSDFAVIPARVSQGHQAYTLVTALFLHGGLWHLAGNMLFLWIFGDNLEDQLGHVRYLAYYLAAGVAGNLLQVLADPASGIPLIGASGSIAGIMGGYMLLFPRARVDVVIIFLIFFRVFALPAWMVLGVWFGLQIAMELSAGQGDGVAYLAHVGGFVAGLAMIFPLWARLGGAGFWDRTTGRPPNPPVDYRMVRTRIPRIPRR
jgi:membrane associated rhomboid family serine protease